ncbi:MAG: helix-turn-helix domain-containing protein [Candidatus Saccharimonadia bacterium]
MRNSEEKAALSSFGKQVKLWRHYRGLTQNDLASLAKLERVQISNIERGKSNPGLLTILRILVALDVTITELLSRSNGF